MGKALTVIAISVGYIAWSKACDNIGINEPIAATVAKVGSIAVRCGKAIGKKAVDKATEAAAEFQRNINKAAGDDPAAGAAS